MPEPSTGEESNQAANFWLYYVLFLAVVVRTFLYLGRGGGLCPVSVRAHGRLPPAEPSAAPSQPRVPALTHVYSACRRRSFSACFSHPLHDYYAMLFLCLSLTASMWLPFGRDIFWMGVFCVALTAGLLIGLRLARGGSVHPFVPGRRDLHRAVRQGQPEGTEARRRSEELRGRLEEANQRLRAYAEQAEETATAQERARLARELHDAVTQTVFGMTLTAEAARIAIEQDPARVPPLLSRLQELARDALGETRAMVDELRPRSVAEAGLVRSLERHLALREKRDGLRVPGGGREERGPLR